MDIRFYHLTRQKLQQALPPLVVKAMQAQKPVLLRTDSLQQTKELSDLLWSIQPQQFIAHGMKGDKVSEEFSAQQPLWITHEDENPNAAKILIQTCPLQVNEAEYDLLCLLFSEHDQDILAQARSLWKDYRSQGVHNLTYWQQSENGWEQKA